MKKILSLLVVIGVAMLVFSNTANAGKVKTTNALKSTIATIEKAEIPATPALNDALKRARDLSKNTWKLQRGEVYKKAGVIYDDLISNLKGSGVQIMKPDWLN